MTRLWLVPKRLRPTTRDLTTRLVSGDNPIRVVMDPHARLSCSHAVFTDATTRTLLVRDEKADAARQCSIGAEVIRLPLRDKKFDLTALLSTLRQRGLYSVFVEGGGTTVSRFLECGLLERLQIAVAPLVIGSGRPGVRLEGDIALKNCLRPMSRLYRMGRDMLFDLELAHSSGERTSDEDFERVL